jgi:hypothetical protein
VLRRRSTLLSLNAWLASAAVAGYFVYLSTVLGVVASDVLRYAVYLGVVTFAPGLAAAVYFWPERLSALPLVCLGAALGYALEAGVYTGLAILDLRGLWIVYPAIGVIALGGLAWRWRRAPGATLAAERPVVIWTRALTISLVVTINTVYLAYLCSIPAGRETLVPVGPDMYLHLSNTIEIARHWPVSDARLAGVPFSYHLLANVHLAAAGAITQIEMQGLLFRLFLGPMLMLVALNVSALVRAFTRSFFVDQAALFMVFLAGTNDLSLVSAKIFRAVIEKGGPPYLNDPWAFTGGGLFSGIGPSYVYGLVLFLPLVSASLRRLTRGVGVEHLPVLGLLMAASMLAKGSFMPVFVAGAAMATLWLAALRKPCWRNAALLVLLSAAVCLPIYFLYFHQYWQGGSEPLEIVPFAIVRQTAMWARFEPVLNSLWDSGGQKGTVDWTFRLVAILTIALLAVIFFFVSFGTRVLGIAYHFGRHGLRMPAKTIMMVSFILTGVAPACLVALTDGNQMHFLNTAYPLAGVLGGVGLGHIVLRRRASMRWRLLQAAALAVLLLSTANNAFFLWGYYRDYEISSTVAGGPRMLSESGLYAAQRWIRENTPTTAVVAASPYSHEAPSLPRRTDYSALAERRAFLEGYHYLRSRDPGELAFRRSLLTSVFRTGDAAALEVMRDRFRVGYLVVETADKLPVKLPEDAVTLVFENAAARVYQVKDRAQ